jgi:hypothetical protein
MAKKDKISAVSHEIWRFVFFNKKVDKAIARFVLICKWNSAVAVNPDYDKIYLNAKKNRIKLIGLFFVLFFHFVTSNPNNTKNKEMNTSNKVTKWDKNRGVWEGNDTKRKKTHKIAKKGRKRGQLTTKCKNWKIRQIFRSRPPLDRPQCRIKLIKI